MKASIGVLSVTFAIVGCATTRTVTTTAPPSPCAQDLMDRGYVSGWNQSRAAASAEAYCTKYKPGEIAIAKDLFDKLYERQFAQGLSDAQTYTPAAIACAKKEFDAAKLAAGNPKLAVTDSCVDATFTSTPETAAVVSPKTHNVFDVLTTDGHYTKFLTAVDKAGLSAALRTGGPWTVLAPTNHAFAAYPGGFDALLEKPDRLKRIVRMHLIDGTRTPTDIKPNEVKKWPTADGKSVVVEHKGDLVIVNHDAKVGKSRLSADNGVVYSIDTLLEP